MTPQEINERIWRISGLNQTDHNYVVKSLNPPDFYNSLDACREFESALRDKDCHSYIHRLCDVCPESKNGQYGYFSVVTATPAQRCEAFLRMKGQWD